MMVIFFDFKYMHSKKEKNNTYTEKYCPIKHEVYILYIIRKHDKPGSSKNLCSWNKNTETNNM